MSWSAGFRLLEAQVIGLYDLCGMNLSKEMLRAVLVPFGDDHDISSGGFSNKHTTDGKNVLEVMVEVWGLPLTLKPTTPQPKGYDEAWEEYYEALWQGVDSITSECGW